MSVPHYKSTLFSENGGREAIETIETIETIEAIEAIETIDTIETIKTIETIGTIETIETIGTIASIESYKLSTACWALSRHSSEQASEGIAHAPRGLSEQGVTIGPSGMHERLNC